MNKKMIKNTKFALMCTIIIILILKYFNAPYSLYSILIWNYDQRMEQNYGFCKNESWGFYNSVVNKFNLQNKKMRIINDEGYVTLENLFNIKKINDTDSQYVLLLNKQTTTNNNHKNIITNLNQYKIKYQFNNCYFFEIND
jgi:hypothetical protein